MGNTFRHSLLRFAQITLGCALYALGFCWFYAPNQMCMGGFTGLAQVIGLFIPVFPVGVQVLLMNLPLFFLIWKKVGRDWLTASLYAMLVSSLLIDLLDQFVTFPPIEPVLACVYGAVLVGTGCGLMLRQTAQQLLLGIGATQEAQAERIESLANRHVDGLIVVLYTLAFHDLSRGLYAVASLYLISLIMDRVVYGGKRSKVACIVSDRYEELTAALLDMNRGITLLSGEGGYTHQARKVILCAFGKNQIIQLKKRVQQVDPDAFIIVYDANEVLGKGFGSYEAGGL